MANSQFLVASFEAAGLGDRLKFLRRLQLLPGSVQDLLGEVRDGSRSLEDRVRSALGILEVVAGLTPTDQDDDLIEKAKELLETGSSFLRMISRLLGDEGDEEVSVNVAAVDAAGDFEVQGLGFIGMFRLAYTIVELLRGDD